MENLESFAFIGTEFINLYSDENPILKENDVTYFLITNNTDYHRPLIAKGLVVEDVFNGDMSKKYFIQLLDIIESPKAIEDFIYNKTFLVYPYDKYVFRAKKYIKPKENFDFKQFAFSVDSFFVRPTEEKIKELQKEYIIIIRKDLNKMLTEIEAF